MPLIRASSGSGSGISVPAHAHGNISNDGKMLVPYGGILAAAGVDAGSFSDGTFPIIQGGGSGGVITVLDGVITVTSAGTGYVNGTAQKAGGSRYTLTVQAKQNASADLPVITTTGGSIVAGSFGTTAGSYCQGNDSRLNRFFTITVDNVDVGRTSTNLPNGWTQQVTLPPDIAELTGGVGGSGCSIESVLYEIKNRIGTGSLFASSTYSAGFRVGSQSVLASTPVNGVTTYNQDNYYAQVALPTRPWQGATGHVFAGATAATGGRALYYGGDLFINSPLNNGTFRVDYHTLTLTAAMDATQTTFTQGSFNGGLNYENNYYKIDNEVVRIVSWPTGSGFSPTIQRAQLGTTAEPHNSGVIANTNLGNALSGGILVKIHLNFRRL